MKARQLLERATSFTSQELEILQRAFDEVWAQIPPSLDGFDDKVRWHLANVVLAVAANGPIELDRIKTEVRSRMGPGLAS